MLIEHVAYWVRDLEKMKNFYERHFGGRAGKLYHNSEKNFSSYFISFDSGGRIEIMHNPSINLEAPTKEKLGLTHLAFSVGDRRKVEELTEELSSAGYQVIGSPRTTGDGYYESVVLDPELNQIEITI